MTTNVKLGASDGSASLTRAVINSAAGGDIAIVAAAPNQIVRLYKLLLVNTAAANVITFKDNTGGNATSGPMALGANAEIILPMDGEPWYQSALGGTVVINSGATQISGTAWFTQTPALAPP